MNNWCRTIPEERIKVLQVVVPVATQLDEEDQLAIGLGLIGQELAKKLYEHHKILVSKSEKKKVEEHVYYSCMIEVIIPREAPI